MEQLLIILGGLGFTGATIWATRTIKSDGWAWALGLILLPLFYVGFGLLANDAIAIKSELIWGLPYFITGTLILLFRNRIPTAAFLITALFWLFHAAYDFWHDLLFINPGVWDWYPLFCAAVDFSVCAYLIYLARNQIRVRAQQV